LQLTIAVVLTREPSAQHAAGLVLGFPALVPHLALPIRGDRLTPVRYLRAILMSRDRSLCIEATSDPELGSSCRRVPRAGSRPTPTDFSSVDPACHEGTRQSARRATDHRPRRLRADNRRFGGLHFVTSPPDCKVVTGSGCEHLTNSTRPGRTLPCLTRTLNGRFRCR
jgi:hypothetical protein